MDSNKMPSLSPFEPAQPNLPVNSETKKQKIYYWVLIMILVVLVAVVGVYIFYKMVFLKVPILPIAQQPVTTNTALPQLLTWAEIDTKIKDCTTQKTDYFKYKCIDDTAEESNKIEVCDQIPEIPIELKAFNVFNQVSRGNCIINFAEKDLNENLCKNIGYEKTRTLCYDNVFWEKATNESSFGYCEKIVNEDFRAQCLGDVSALKNDIAFCDKFKPRSIDGNVLSFKDDCLGHYYFFKAMNSKDVNNCLNISEESHWRSLCIDRLATDQKNLDFCYNIKLESDSCVCFNGVLDEINAQKCSEIKDNKGRTTCQSCLKKNQ